MDSSKNVEMIIQTLDKLRCEFPEIKLLLIGNSSESLLTEFNSSWVTAQSSIKRENLPREFAKHGTFIHAFIGSLDKVLVEAVMMQMPVLSINPEFLKEFVIFGADESDRSLYSQTRNYLLQDSESIDKVVAVNLERAIDRHELVGWISRLTNVITAGK